MTEAVRNGATAFPFCADGSRWLTVQPQPDGRLWLQIEDDLDGATTSVVLSANEKARLVEILCGGRRDSTKEGA